MRLRRRPSEQEQRLLDSVLFDEQWYGERAGVRLDREEAVRHYLDEGVPAGLSPHPLFDPAYVRRRLGPKRLARLGDRDPLTFVLERGLKLATHPLAAPVAAGLVEGDLATWIRQRYAAWPQLPQQAIRPDAVASVMVTCGSAPENTLRAVRAASETAGDQAEVLVVDATGSASDGIVLEALAGLPGVRVVRGDADPAAEIVVLLHDHSKPRSGWLPPLVAALDNPAVLAASPLLVGPSGAIESAGAAFPSTGGLPHPLLRDFPTEDASSVGAVRFSALTGGALAVRRTDLDELGAPDTELDGLAEADLCLRLATRRRGRFRVVAESRVRHLPDPTAHEARKRFRERWRDLPGDDVRLWAACGFRVVDHEVCRDAWDAGHAVDAASMPAGGADDPALGVPLPVLMREARLSVSESPRPLRWAIKNPAPTGPAGEEWGDTHFARDLARALRSLGHEVVIDHREGFYRPTLRHDDIALVLRGPIRYLPSPEQVNLAWVISHPDTITREEVAGFDGVVAASIAWARRRSADWDMPIEPLLQATDPVRFRPDAAQPDSGAKVLFVGNSRKTYRAIVRDAVESGVPLTVYGADWEPFLPPGLVAATHLDNAKLSAAYRAAGVVLNDHWDDMRAEGFISNRLFDAAASAARVVSDDVAGLAGLFGRSVQVARSRDDLVRLCTLEDPDAVFGSESDRIAVATRVAREHSFAARAGALIDLAHAARRRRGFAS